MTFTLFCIHNSAKTIMWCNIDNSTTAHLHSVDDVGLGEGGSYDLFNVAAFMGTKSSAAVKRQSDAENGRDVDKGESVSGGKDVGTGVDKDAAEHAIALSKLEEVCEVIAAHNTTTRQAVGLLPHPDEDGKSWVPVAEYTNARFVGDSDDVLGKYRLMELTRLLQGRDQVRAIQDVDRRTLSASGRDTCPGSERQSRSAFFMEALQRLTRGQYEMRTQKMCDVCKTNADGYRASLPSTSATAKDISGWHAPISASSTPLSSSQQRSSLFTSDNERGLVGDDLFTLKEHVPAWCRYAFDPLQILFNLTPTKHHFLQVLREELARCDLPLTEAECRGGETKRERRWLDKLLLTTMCERNICYFEQLYGNQCREFLRTVVDPDDANKTDAISVRPIVFLPSAVAYWYQQKTHRFLNEVPPRLTHPPSVDPVLHTLAPSAPGTVHFGTDNKEDENEICVEYVELYSLVTLLYHLYSKLHGATTATAGLRQQEHGTTGALQKRRRDNIQTCIACALYQNMSQTFEARRFVRCETCREGRLGIVYEYDLPCDVLYEGNLEYGCMWETCRDSSRVWLHKGCDALQANEPLANYVMNFNEALSDPLFVVKRNDSEQY